MIRFNGVFKKEINLKTNGHEDPVGFFLFRNLPKIGGQFWNPVSAKDMLQEAIPYIDLQLGINFEKEAFGPLAMIDFPEYNTANVQKLIAIDPLSSAYQMLLKHSRFTLNNLDEYFLSPLKKLEEDMEEGDTSCLLLLPHIVGSCNFFSRIGESFAQKALNHILPVINLEKTKEKDDLSYAVNGVMVSSLAFLLLKMHLFLIKVEGITNKSLSDNLKNHFYDHFLLEYQPKFIQKILENHPSQLEEKGLHSLMSQDHLDFLHSYMQNLSFLENAMNEKKQATGKYLSSMIATLYSTAHLQDFCKTMDIADLSKMEMEDIEPFAIFQETYRMREDITQVRPSFIDLVFLVQKILNSYDRLQDNAIFIKSNLNGVEAEIDIDKLTPIEKYSILYVLAKEFANLIHTDKYLLKDKLKSLVTLFNHLFSTIEISQQTIIYTLVRPCFIVNSGLSQEKPWIEFSKQQEALLSPMLIHYLSQDLENLTPKEKHRLLDTLTTLFSPFSLDNNSVIIQKNILQPLLSLLKQLTSIADAPLNARIAEQFFYMWEVELPLSYRLGVIKLQEILLSSAVLENISRFKDHNKWLLWTRKQFSQCGNSALDALKHTNLEKLETSLQEYCSWMAIYLRLVEIPNFLPSKQLIIVKNSFIELATRISSHLKTNANPNEPEKLRGLLRDFVKQLVEIKTLSSTSTKSTNKIIEPTAYNALEKAINPVKKRKKSKKKSKANSEVLAPPIKESAPINLKQFLATECLIKNETPSDEDATKTIKESKISSFLGTPTTLSNKFFALASNKKKKYNQDTSALKGETIIEAPSAIEIREPGKTVKIDLVLSANRNVINNIKSTPSDCHCAHIILGRDSLNIHHDDIHCKESISPYKIEDLFKALKSKSYTTAFVQQKKGHYQPLISFNLSVEEFHEVLATLGFENKHKPSLSRAVSSYSFKNPCDSTQDKNVQAREAKIPPVNSALKRSESSFHLIKKTQPLEKQEPLPLKKKSILSRISFLNPRKTQAKIEKKVSSQENLRHSNIEPVLFEWPDRIDNKPCLWQVYAKAVAAQVPHLEVMLLGSELPEPTRFRIKFHTRDEWFRLKGYFFNFNKGAHYIIPAEENYVPVLEKIGISNHEEKNLYIPPDEIVAFYFHYCIANNIFYQYSDNGEYIPARDAPITPIVGYLDQNGHLLSSFPGLLNEQNDHLPQSSMFQI